MRLIDADGVMREISKNHDACLGEMPLGNRSYEDITKCLMMAYDKGVEYAAEMVKNAPTEVDTVKHGVLTQDWLAERLGLFLCSVCSQPMALGDKYGNTHKVIYCPNCGAKLDGGE